MIAQVARDPSKATQYLARLTRSTTDCSEAACSSTMSSSRRSARSWTSSLHVPAGRQSTDEVTHRANRGIATGEPVAITISRGSGLGASTLQMLVERDNELVPEDHRTIDAVGRDPE